MKKANSLIMVIALIALSCNPQGAKETQPENQKEESGYNLSISKSVIDDLKSTSRVIDPDKTGKFINPTMGTRYLQEYKEEKKRLVAELGGTYDVKEDIYGFGFGLNKFKTLIERIEAHNERCEQDEICKKDSLITGIRVYYSERTWRNSGGNREHHPDVFLIPVIANGNNFYTVDADFQALELDSIRDVSDRIMKEVPFMEDDGMVLNTSKPCPNLCN